MGTCYTYLLCDEFDWDYFSESKSSKIEAITNEFPYVEVLAQWPHYIVLDLEKTSPLGDKAQQLQKYCDVCYYYPDNAIYEIKELRFRPLPKDKIAEANESANRNAEYIKQANEQWMSKWDYDK